MNNVTGAVSASNCSTLLYQGIIIVILDLQRDRQTDGQDL